jgi:hypothetical protein
LRPGPSTLPGLPARARRTQLPRPWYLPTYLPIYPSTQPRTCVCVRSCEWAGLSQPVHQIRANPSRKRNCKVPAAPQQGTKQKAQHYVASSSARRYASGHRHRHRQARVTCGKACVRRQRSCVLRKLPAVCHGSACATEAFVRACMRACGCAGVRACRLRTCTHPVSCA